MTSQMTIGDAAAATGLSAKMIRHYEQLGLMPGAHRSEAGYRLYGERELSVLRFIQQARRLGFSMKQIGELIGLWSRRERSSRDVKALAQQHLDELDAKLAELQAMKDGLQALIAACHGDDDPNCPILDTLAADSPSVPPACHAAPRAAAPAAATPARVAGRFTPTHSAVGTTPTTPTTPTTTATQDLMAWTRLAARR